MKKRKANNSTFNRKVKNTAKAIHSINYYTNKLIGELFLSYNSVNATVTIEGTRDVDPSCPNRLTGPVVQRAQKLLLRDPRDWTFWLAIFYEEGGVASYTTSTNHYDSITSATLDNNIRTRIVELGHEIVKGKDLTLHHFAWVCLPKRVEQAIIDKNEDEWIETITDDYDMMSGRAMRFESLTDGDGIDG